MTDRCSHSESGPGRRVTSSSPSTGWAVTNATSLLQGGLVVPSLSGAAVVPPGDARNVL